MKDLTDPGDSRNQSGSLLRYAYSIAQQSKDPSTQNGAVLVDPKSFRVITAACNKLPTGLINVENRWQRPSKCDYIEHAERGVIYKAAELGISTKGKILVCPWAACCDCARAIICARINKLISYRPAYDRSPDRWKSNIDLALSMLVEAGVVVEWHTQPLYSQFPIRFNEEVWVP